MLKIEKRVPITPKRRKKVEQQEELIATIAEMDHMQSVFIPKGFLSAETVRRIVRTQGPKWKKWAFEIRKAKLHNQDGVRLWSINKEVVD